MYEDFIWTRVSDRRNDLTKVYEPIQPYFLLVMARKLKNATFFDIGANIGFYSVVIGNDDSVGKINAFEPMPDCISEIVANLKRNSLDTKGQVFPIALSDKSGELDFRVDRAYSGGNGVLETHLFKETEP